MKDIIFAALFVILGTFVLIGSSLVLINWLENKKCESIAMKINVPYSYSFFEGCLFKINNQWIPATTLNNVNLLKERN